MKLSRKTLESRLDTLYDVIIVGGGAGGLSAAIYLGRYGLKCLVVEKGRGRSLWMQELRNYLGLAPTTPGRDILHQGREHLLSLGVDYLMGYVEQVTDQGETFAVQVKVGKEHSTYPVFQSRYVIAASGVIDYLPELPDMQNVYDYAGYTLHVCLICDGYDMWDQHAVLIAGSEGQINTAFVLNWFTPYISVLTHGLCAVSDDMRRKLAEHGYPLYETPITRFLGADHHLSGVELSDGTIVPATTGLVAMGSRYHSDYLQGIPGLEWQGKNLITDATCRTGHPRLFALGDLKQGLNQVAIAVADGVQASTAIWREIRRTQPPRKWEANLEGALPGSSTPPVTAPPTASEMPETVILLSNAVVGS